METGSRRSRLLWTEEPVGRRRMPDPVRASAVRAGLLVSTTMIEAMVAVLGTLAHTWIAPPAALCTVVSTVVTTWAVLDVWITRQVWNQRNGVVSGPSSAARALRRERRRARKARRAEARLARRVRRPPDVLPGPDVLSGT
ncbi:hypothetical protein NGB36_23890 [Streptomyces sp. RB6PN25]|uniref:Uncharacterized protein n=1 Tax=Streptomyces humicola TaxID=2953240 RepID=A0ABT1Q448_9ACTN|nr:hypothetical protein [Streptomyces humicola]MCQ4083555.1 hypothetical protein [Streptomyces humicola]